MSNEGPARTGIIGWIDLTVENAAALSEFYGAVAGWHPTPVDMGGYSDYVMTPSGAAAPVAGVCHARGANASVPPVWLIYIHVANLEESLQRCVERGGKPVGSIRNAGSSGRFCIIQDPAGAHCALFEPAAAKPTD